MSRKLVWGILMFITSAFSLFFCGLYYEFDLTEPKLTIFAFIVSALINFISVVIIEYHFSQKDKEGE